MNFENILRRVLGLLFAVLLISCQDNQFKMSSVAMEPTIKNGEIITIDLEAFREQDPKRGDIVMFHSPTMPNTDWIMRVAGLPGETVSYDSLGLLLDGNKFESTNINYKLYFAGVDSSALIKHPYEIPDEQFYLIGDNVEDSFDSRFWGSIEKKEIIGLVQK